jgi:PhoPQ-activated pathogenicity-related protein
MMILGIRMQSLLIVIIVSLIATSACESRANNWGVKAMRDYIAMDDGYYDYRLLGSEIVAAGRVEVHTFNMTSQRWLNAQQVNRPIWWHYLHIAVPKNANGKIENGSIALLMIDDASNQNGGGSTIRALAVATALQTRCVVADLRQIPNEPLLFASDPQQKPRAEDDLIAYGYHRFMVTLDVEWIPLLPMAKAVVKAMDTVQSVHPFVARFVLAGWSKRAWCLLTGGVTDARVVAVAPMVMEISNTLAVLEHMWRVYGFWPPAVQPYVRNNVTADMYTEQFQLLADVIDPLNYKSYLDAVPLLFTSASGDQFFPPDSAALGEYRYGGETHHFFAANENHMLTHANGPDNAMRFFAMFAANVARPRYTFAATPSADRQHAVIAASVHGSWLPQQVKLWTSTNSTARDYRFVEACGRYAQQVLFASDASASVYEAHVSAPPAGWTSAYVELTFVEPHVGLFSVTSIPIIVPFGSLPFAKPVEHSDLPPLS